MTATLTVTVVGCSGSYPGPHSPASCYLLESTVNGETTRVVLDLGSGSLGHLQRYVDPFDIDAILVTHLHPDHFMDLTGLYVLRKYHPERRPGPTRLPVYAPKGMFKRLQLAYYGTAEMKQGEQFDHRRVIDGEVIEIGSLRVTPRQVEHPIEAYGYRFESPAGTVAFTGDTDTCPALTPLLENADIALADGAFVTGRDEIRGIHLTPRRAAEAAIAAGGVKRLILTHIPPWNDPQACLREAAELWPDVEVSHAGARYSLSS